MFYSAINRVSAMKLNTYQLLASLIRSIEQRISLTDFFFEAVGIFIYLLLVSLILCSVILARSP